MSNEILIIFGTLLLVLRNLRNIAITRITAFNIYFLNIHKSRSKLLKFLYSFTILFPLWILLTLICRFTKTLYTIYFVFIQIDLYFYLGAAARLDEAQVERVVTWLAAERVGVLNVAGPRELLRPGIQEVTHRFMSAVLHRVLCKWFHTPSCLHELVSFYKQSAYTVFVLVTFSHLLFPDRLVVFSFYIWQCTHYTKV